MSAVAAGYVDRPRSDLVVRLLELFIIPEHEFEQKAGKERKLEGVNDALLYQRLLKPAERSAVFAIQSPSAGQFSGDLALHFFYLNVGRENDPSLARVEIPAWVAQRPLLINRLHAVLIAQCQASGARPFPYALHRAHEVAVIKLDEKNQLTVMIQAELARNGVEIGEASHKQGVKDISGSRTR
jgi:hypothetical protein